MATFQASGVVLVNGRLAANVLVSFALPGKLSPLSRRVPPEVRTDKLGRFAQTGFVEGVSYRAAASSAGVTFAPARATLTATQRPCASTGRPPPLPAGGWCGSPR